MKLCARGGGEMELGIRDIKWSSYGEKYCKSLSKRGCDELKALVTEERFSKPTNPNDSGTLIGTLFTAVVSLCDQLKKDNQQVTPKDFWEAHPYQSILTRIGAKSAQVQEEDDEEEWMPGKSSKRNLRKKKKKQSEKAPEVASANLAKGKGAGGKSGNKGAKGASGTSQARAKGGRGTKPKGKQADTPTEKVVCDSKNCTHKVNPRRDVPNPLLCAPCTQWQEDNYHRFGDFYLNKQWQLRPFVSKNGPSEDPPRGRKKARFDERDRPSRRPSEDARSRKGDNPKGYSASMVAEVSAQVTKTVLQALKADRPQRDRSRSRSRSTDRTNRRFRRDHSSDEDSEEEHRRRR